jgi:Leucine-rich repeat (LRR) protein
MQLLHISLLSLLLIHAFCVQSCVEHERDALLQFQAGVSDPSNRLASWSGDKCCNWACIQCDNRTGHVIHLDLRNHYSYLENPYYPDLKYRLSGKVSPSLIALRDLKYLDLSYNNFFGKIPEFIGMFGKLEYLNLSNSQFSGEVPPHLGNLSQLQYLDISCKTIWGWSTDETTESAEISWLSRLKSLRYLDMSFVDLHSLKVWAQSLNKLPSLEVLILEGNSLTCIPQSLSSVNFTSLRVLHLYDQNFNTTIPNWIFSLRGLITLNLGFSGFEGLIPEALGNLTLLHELVLADSLYGKIPLLYNLTKLNYLDLSGISVGEHTNVLDIPSSFLPQTWRRMQGLILEGCNLSGTLPEWIDEMASLQYLVLGDNHLSGAIPVYVGNLINLIELDLSLNLFTGLLTDAHLHGLSKLEHLILEGNPISLAIKQNWQPSFRLQTLRLDSCKVGPKFPAWLQKQLKIEKVILSNTQIDDLIPSWFWSLKSMKNLDLSNNKIRGTLPKSLTYLMNLNFLFLNSNQLEGRVPSSFANYLLNIDLSDNKFQQLPRTFQAPGLTKFYLFNNNLNGSIEFCLCRLTNLAYIDFSSNNLYGYLPNCLPNLEGLNIANNKIFGTIPGSLCNISSSLFELQVGNNNLTGSFPPTLQFCTELDFIDLGKNRFYGELPEWLGESWPLLNLLSLRSNSFFGSIPSKLTLLNNLQILDLANNQFSGPIPAHLDNFTSMGNMNPNELAYAEGWSATMKDIDIEYIPYDKSLEYLRSIDLSNNYLTGEIPETVVALAGLLNLNLSHNHLVGKIPFKIGNMKSLESLDLHMNKLSGTIPESMSDLRSLEVLNLSYNNLSGVIPTGPQLQTLVDPSIYAGNPYLCGPPLKISCSSTGRSPDGNNSSDYNAKDPDQKEKLWLYLSIEFGFVTGFLVVIFILLFKRNWRYAYFQLVYNLIDKLYVSGAIILKKLRKE